MDSRAVVATDICLSNVKPLKSRQSPLSRPGGILTPTNTQYHTFSQMSRQTVDNSSNGQRASRVLIRACWLYAGPNRIIHFIRNAFHQIRCLEDNLDFSTIYWSSYKSNITFGIAIHSYTFEWLMPVLDLSLYVQLGNIFIPKRHIHSEKKLQNLLFIDKPDQWQSLP